MNTKELLPNAKFAKAPTVLSRCFAATLLIDGR